MRLSFWLATCLLTLSLQTSGYALGPDDIYIVVNQNVAESQGVAGHYCMARKVPADHVLALDLPSSEDISRTDYDARLAGPLRERLAEKREQVKVLLTTYGVPLRVGGQEPSSEERAALNTLGKELAPLEAKRKELDEAIRELEAQAKEKPEAKSAEQVAERRKEREQLENQIRPLERRRRFLSHSESHAAVDSELVMLWRQDYELRGFLPNPLYFQAADEDRQEQQIVMTCRLDGPSVELIKRLVDDSVATEARGLMGNVHVDARGIKYDPSEGGYGYGGYDESMREMARLLADAGGMAVTLDDQSELFAPGSCSDCALYCGWYSHANFVDCCKFVPGAVAWHLASSEAVSLRDANSKLWCKNLLERGAAATLGPVAEPYTIGFPKPAEFFGTLLTGQYTLVETYWRTEMFVSWMTVLVGDPLYNPFARSHKLAIEQIKPSPAGAPFPPGKRNR